MRRLRFFMACGGSIVEPPMAARSLGAVDATPSA